MSRFFHMSDRARRIVYSILAIYAFSVGTVRILDVMVFNVTSNDQCAWLPVPGGKGLLIQSVIPNGVTDQAGIRNGDILLKVNGEDASAGRSQKIIDSLKAGESATYLVQRGGQTFETSVRMLKLFDISALSFYFLGLGFLIVGTTIVLTKPSGSLQRLFGRYGILSMLVFGLQRFTSDTTDQMWKRGLILSGGIIGHLFGPPVFALFFLRFPVRVPISGRRWFRVLLYGLSIAAITILLVDTKQVIPTTIRILLFYFPLIAFIFGLSRFMTQYFKERDPETRRQLKPILLAVIVGALTFSYMLILTTVNPFFVFLNPLTMIPTVLLITVPVGFGYAIFRYRLMDIDLIIKRSLVYATLTALIVAVYLIAISLIGNFFTYVTGTEDNRVINVLAFVIIALIFDPVKRRTQEGIDKLFYQERLNYQKALLEFSQELPRQTNVDQILSSTAQRISSTMHVEKVAVIICDDQTGCNSARINIPEPCCVFEPELDGLRALLDRTKTPQSLVITDEEIQTRIASSRDRDRISRGGIVLSVPMVLQERVIGMINVGPKLSGRMHSQDDIILLNTVANQAAIAVENARLHQSEIQKQRIEEELRLAWKIQQNLLPKSAPVIAGLDIAGTTVPARTVGGDYFDYVQLDDRRVLTVVADVSGKGMSAALYMSKVQGMVQLAARMYETPKEILTHVNRRLYEGMERASFITMIVALFDMSTNTVTICRAGHTRAIVSRNGTQTFLRGSGIGLGLERGPLFEGKLEELRLPVRQGDLFVLYTDGLTEASDANQEMFGEEALAQVVERHKDAGSNDLLEHVLTAVRTFEHEAEQHDDITLVVIKASDNTHAHS